jgi:hypothetical protein
VGPFELLNHDMETDDVAYIAEKMRQDEVVAEVVRGRLIGLTEQGRGAHESKQGIAWGLPSCTSSTMSVTNCAGQAFGAVF